MKTKRLTKTVIDDITSKVSVTFRSFVGGSYTPDNPISIALADSRPQFAAGVDIEDVVRFILNQAKDR
jgi:hypothetical protein